MSKKQLLFNAFNNKEVERVPVGFWFHFVEGEEFNQGVERKEIIQKNIDGHRAFYEKFKPDFIKLMSDGFFQYPNDVLIKGGTTKELKQIKPLGKNHPWIEKQVKLVKSLTDIFGNDVATFYNIFSPATFLRIQLTNSKSNITISDYFKEDKEALKYALSVISEDLATLAARVIEEGGADGIYLSVQNVQKNDFTETDYLDLIAPSELNVLQAANSVSDNNILHICGYEGARNDLTIYKDYNAKVINWAVNVEKVSLLEGKKLFGNRVVIGGFDNTANGILYRGSKEEIEKVTEQLLKEASTTGIILGADCTVPSDIDLKHLEWVREKAAELSQKERVV